MYMGVRHYARYTNVITASVSASGVWIGYAPGMRRGADQVNNNKELAK